MLITAVRRPLLLAVALALVIGMLPGYSATFHAATGFSFSTGSPDGRMGMASRPSRPGEIEIEAADDFVTTTTTTLNLASFTGLLTGGAATSNITKVVVEIYRVFPNDSANPPDGHVPTRVNGPS